MRTTLMLDPEVAERLQQELALGRGSFKEIVNRALKRGLGIEPLPRRAPFRVRPHSSAFQPGIDLGRLNQIVDDLEVEEFLKPRKPAKR